MTVALAAAAPNCPAVAGAERLWNAQTSYVLVGELHGTAETPATFADLVCLAAASGRRVTVAIELNAEYQPQLDAFLASNGREASRAALLRLPIWNQKFQDGRSSTATLAMLERLRRMRHAGLIDAVVCADPETQPGETRDAAMARAWQAVRLRDHGILIALTGNVHAMRAAMIRPNRTIVTAGSLMPRDRTITLDVRGNGGFAWGCQADGCSVHSSGRARTALRGIIFTTDAAERWDAILELGAPTTAALPAVMPPRPVPPEPIKMGPSGGV